MAEQRQVTSRLPLQHTVSEVPNAGPALQHTTDLVPRCARLHLPICLQLLCYAFSYMQQVVVHFSTYRCAASIVLSATVHPDSPPPPPVPCTLVPSDTRRGWLDPLHTCTTQFFLRPKNHVFLADAQTSPYSLRFLHFFLVWGGFSFFKASFILFYILFLRCKIWFCEAETIPGSAEYDDTQVLHLPTPRIYSAVTLPTQPGVHVLIRRRHQIHTHRVCSDYAHSVYICRILYPPRHHLPVV